MAVPTMAPPNNRVPDPACCQVKPTNRQPRNGNKDRPMVVLFLTFYSKPVSDIRYVVPGCNVDLLEGGKRIYTMQTRIQFTCFVCTRWWWWWWGVLPSFRFPLLRMNLSRARLELRDANFQLYAFHTFVERERDTHKNTIISQQDTYTN